MSDRIKHIFIITFIFSVFSLTLRGTAINLCKESKVFKNQSNPNTEKEEGNNDNNETDEEVFFIAHHALFYSCEDFLKHNYVGLNINYPCHSKNIFVPPPKT